MTPHTTNDAVLHAARRHSGDVIPERPSSHPILVEFSDGHVARLPSLGDSDPLARIAARLFAAAQVSR
jgi:hypothetical protein